MLKKNDIGRHFPFGLLGLALFAGALSSCSPVKFVSEWRDPAYTSQPKKILVYVASRSPTVKTIFENQLAERLREHGVAALPGHEFLPDWMIIKRDAIRLVAKEKGVDAVFIAGPTNRKYLESLRPGELSYAAAMYEDQTITDYYNFSAFLDRAMYPASTYAGEEIFEEMVLYDARSNKRIWSALSRSYVWDSGVDEIKPTVSRVVDMLATEGIIP